MEEEHNHNDIKNKNCNNILNVQTHFKNNIFYIIIIINNQVISWHTVCSLIQRMDISVP